MRLFLRSLPSRASIRLAIIGVLLAVLAGCSIVKFAYGHASTIAFDWLDDYIELDDAQAARLRPAIEDFFAWHRRTQLADYADFLARIGREVPGEATPQSMCVLRAEVRRRIDAALERALPALAELAPTLTAKQIAHVEKRYAEKNKQHRDEFMQPDLAKRQRAALKRGIEYARTLYGSVDDAQRELIARTLKESPADAEVAYAERLQRQQEGLALLRRLSTVPGGRDDAQLQIRAYLQSFERSPREAYRRYSERLDAANCSYASALHNTTSAAQRQAAARKLKGYEAMLRELAGAASG